ncbi:MAG: MTH865 family protein [Methanocella sp.]
MAEKKENYTIYGSVTGPASEYSPQSPAGGPQQPSWLHRMEDIKVEIERFLQGLDITYPIRSRGEFMSALTSDIPGICELERRTLSLRDLVSIMRDDDFPIKSDHEAANLLAGTCPVRTPNIR